MTLKALLALIILFICLKYEFSNSRKLKKMTIPEFTRYSGVLYKTQKNKTATYTVKKVIRTEPFRQNLKVKLLYILIQLLRLATSLLYIWAILVNTKNLPFCFGLLGFTLLPVILLVLLPAAIIYNYWAHKNEILPNIAIPTKINHASEMRIRYHIAGYLLIVSLAFINVML